MSQATRKDDDLPSTPDDGGGGDGNDDGARGWDCSALLDLVAVEEASFLMKNPSDHVDFGHPDPPRLQVLPVFATASGSLGSKATGTDSNVMETDHEKLENEEVVFTVAYTDHCVVAQALKSGHGEGSSKALVLGSLPILLESEEAEDEIIHTVTVVVRESLAFLDSPKDQKPDVLVIDDDSEEPSQSDPIGMDTSPDNMDDTVQDPTAAPLPQEFILAIVLGTTEARVYSSEVLVTIATSSEGVIKTSLSLSPTLIARNTMYVEVLPKDDNDTINSLERYARRHRNRPSSEPFIPTGKVLSIQPFRLKISYGKASEKSTYGTYLWVTYQDGCLVRLHHAAVFPSVWQIGASRNVSLEELLLPITISDSVSAIGSPVLRCQVMIPSQKDNDLHIVPLPRHHPSPLAPLPLLNGTLETESMVESIDGLLGNVNNETVEALVIGGNKNDPLMPTLIVYSSEDQMTGRIKGDIETSSTDGVPNDSLVSSVVGSTKAVVEGFAGVFRWGLGGRSSRASSILSRRSSAVSSKYDPDENDTENDTKNDIDDNLPLTPFPSLWRPPITLYAAHEFHETPREIESCVIDASGCLAALADNLGRILIFDLRTRQVVRMWKGFREASCFWLQMNKGTSAMTNYPTTHLVIHSRHRHVLEIWGILQGPRIQVVRVDRGAVVLSSPPIGRCDSSSNNMEIYIVHSLIRGVANRMEKLLLLSGEKGTGHMDGATSATVSTTSTSSRGAALRLQHLQQLLSATDLQHTKEDVLEAVRMIKSLDDLSTALDLISKASLLEKRLGISGSSFQKAVLEYCHETLSSARKEDGDSVHSPAAKDLSRRLDYYTQLVKAYDLISSSSIDYSERSEALNGEGDFIEEAVGWMSTFEKVSRSQITDLGDVVKTEPLRFSAFALSFVYPAHEIRSGEVLEIYFSDSTKTRTDMLVHVFKPLLGWFSAGTVTSFFDILHIKNDVAYIQTCFGEWFMTLSKQQMLQHGLYLHDSPMNRFLDGLVESQLNNKDEPPLNPLLRICCESDALVRSFVLATLCRRAVANAAARERNKSKAGMYIDLLMADWDALLRKLRVCLLASLRLHEYRLGTVPLSVYNLEVENEFSVYEWLARDELLISHRQDEICILEEACRISAHCIEPSSDGADSIDIVANLQKACLATGESPMQGDPSNSLLLYFPRHNVGPILAAHRSLLLASAWLKNPEDLTLLEDSFCAAQALGGQPALAFAVRLELWTRVVCPLYRARLFGFVDVPELAEEDFTVLLQQRKWLQEFGRLSLRILELVNEIEWSKDLGSYPWPESNNESSPWPPLRPDFILERALRKIRPINELSRDAHTVVICGLLVSDDMSALATCIPAVYDCFLSLSLFNPVTWLPSPSPEQDTFLASAILVQARNYVGPPLESFRLGELAILGEKWGFSLSTLRTLYLLAMYEFGKDSIVDDLLTRAFTQIDELRFLDGGLDIVCCRLDLLFRSDFMKSRHMREIMGVLDAGLCDWIQERAALAEADQVHGVVTDPLIGLNATHVLTLRLLSLSKTASVDTSLRVKIHSIAVLTGTLLKEVQEAS